MVFMVLFGETGLAKSEMNSRTFLFEILLICRGSKKKNHNMLTMLKTSITQLPKENEEYFLTDFLPCFQVFVYVARVKLYKSHDN